jgi:type II secretory pathway pseudopilin PulG
MDNRQGARREAGPQPAGEQGFMLLGLIVAIAIILIALSVAASREAFTLRREREAESVHRANQYVRAIQLYYKKFARYPASIEQLENSNNVRYLRKRYIDPLTGKADYRLIAVGQNQTTVKGFFGEPLSAIGGPGLGALAGMQSAGMGGAGGANGAAGLNGAAGVNAAAGTAGANSSTDASGQSGFGGQLGFGGQSGIGTAAGIGGQSAIGFGGSGGGPFMGVGSSASGNSILTPNEQTTYQTWEFLYDPRLELLKLAAALNGGADALGGGALGQSPGSMGQQPNGFGQSPNGLGQSPGNSGQSPSTPNGTSQPTSP